MICEVCLDPRGYIQRSPSSPGLEPEFDSLDQRKPSRKGRHALKADLDLSHFNQEALDALATNHTTKNQSPKADLLAKEERLKKSGLTFRSLRANIAEIQRELHQKNSPLARVQAISTPKFSFSDHSATNAASLATTRMNTEIEKLKYKRAKVHETSDEERGQSVSEATKKRARRGTLAAAKKEVTAVLE